MYGNINASNDVSELPSSERKNMSSNRLSILYVSIPCYNEEDALHVYGECGDTLMMKVVHQLSRTGVLH